MALLSKKKKKKKFLRPTEENLFPKMCRKESLVLVYCRDYRVDLFSTVPCTGSPECRAHILKRLSMPEDVHNFGL